jgi:hypothetical protein
MNYIIDPITLKSYSLISTNGINTLKSYITHYQSGGSNSRTGGSSKTTRRTRTRRESNTATSAGRSSRRESGAAAASTRRPQNPRRSGQPLSIRTHNIGQCNIYGWDTEGNEIEDGKETNTSYYHSPRSGKTHRQRTVAEYIRSQEERVLNATDIFLLQEVCSDGTQIFEDEFGNTWNVYWRGTSAQKDIGILLESNDLPLPTAVVRDGKWDIININQDQANLINNRYKSYIKGCAVVCKRQDPHFTSELYDNRYLRIRSSPIVKVQITSDGTPATIREIYVCSIHIPISQRDAQLYNFGELMTAYKDYPFVFGGDFNSPPSKRLYQGFKNICNFNTCQTSYGTGGQKGNSIDDIYLNKFDNIGMPSFAFYNSICSNKARRSPEYLISDFDHKFLATTVKPPSPKVQKKAADAEAESTESGEGNRFASLVGMSSTESTELTSAEAEAQRQTKAEALRKRQAAEAEAEAQRQAEAEAEAEAQKKSIKKQLKYLEGHPSEQEKINELAEYIHRNNISLDTFESVVTNRRGGNELDQIAQSIRTKIDEIEAEAEAEAEVQRQAAEAETQRQIQAAKSRQSKSRQSRQSRQSWKSKSRKGKGRGKKKK